MSLIEFHDVGRVYSLGGGAVHALSHVDVEIDAGEFVSVIGPSGSGKSTFMNLCGCLDSPTSGGISIDGVRLESLAPDQLSEMRNTRIGFVFQQFNLLARTSALDNVALPLIYAGVARRERRIRAAAALEQVGLADRGDHHPSQLSGGQQQRVAIARALVNNPVLVLADEPTGALDTQTSAEVMALFQDLNDRGITIVLVTHEQEVAAAGKRILHFRDGALTHDEQIQQTRYDLPSLEVV